MRVDMSENSSYLRPVHTPVMLVRSHNGSLATSTLQYLWTSLL